MDSLRGAVESWLDTEDVNMNSKSWQFSDEKGSAILIVLPAEVADSLTRSLEYVQGF
jgi:hypothetical protein